MYKSKIVALCAIVMSMSVHANIEEEIVKSFSVDEKAELRLENINGDVEIKGWDKNEIRVTAIITAKDQEARDRITLEMNGNGRGVRIETEYKKNSSGWGNNHAGSVDYMVMVPSHAKLPSIDLVNGSMSVEGVKGEMKIDLVNGSITATGLSSNSEINSVNGKIIASYSSIGDDLNDISIDTVNGRIQLSLPDNISADVDIETMHGSIRNDFGLSANKNMFSGKNLQGTIGSGDVRISIETINGGVRLLKN